MNTQIFTILTIAFLATSCFDQAKDNTRSSTEKVSTNYEGPIIDMHIHAYSSENPMFGLEYIKPN